MPWIAIAPVALVALGSLVYYLGRAKGIASATKGSAGAAGPVAASSANPGEMLHLAAEKESPASVVAALRASQFDELDRLLRQLTESEAAEPEKGEIAALLAFQAFRSADETLEPILLKWREHSPQSPFADFALASYFDNRAWAERGHRWAKDTPESAFSDFESWRAKALPLARSAVDREPRFVEGWRLLIHLALGDPRKCIAISTEALSGLSASWRVRTALLHCLRPRWGGRYDVLDAVAKDAQRFASRNAHLHWLLGYSAYDRADLAGVDKDQDVAQRWISEALTQGGEDPQYLGESIGILRRSHRSTEALAEADRALVAWPDQVDLLKERLFCLSALGREGEAREVAERVTAIDPTDTYVANWRRWSAREAREACVSLGRNGAADIAVVRCGEAAELDVSDAESRYWLGRAHLKLEKWDLAQQAFEAALRVDPRHRESIVNLDWLHGRNQDWKPILELWTNYLELEPGDARAWLERAGTWRHAGDLAKACSDLRRACELRNEQACGYERSSCR
jgi:tetratricopeptide (TPR) repeat protein